MAQYEIKKCDITIECGATFTMYFVVRDNNNSLVDLTGSTVEAQLREYAEANDYFEFTATHNGSGGRVTLTMPFEDTAAIPYTSGVYDVYITDQNNDREKYLIGDVNIVPAVTKPVAGEIIYLLSFASEDDFPSYGMVRRLYFSHATNHMYRWNGTDYVDIVTDGEAATVEVGEVETLQAGSDATVENVGSLLNAVFNFGIPEGNGIASIEKTGTDVLTDTYTVTFTDPNVEAFDFDVTNGKGIVSIAEVVSGLTHTFTVTYNDGDTFTYTLTDGNGIVSVEKTGATDNVDHYRITFDDGSYFDYNVTNVDTSEFYDKDSIDTLLADKADVGDSYTKDEEDALLADKADSADLGDLASKDTVDWDSDIDNIPSTFPPEAHNHDDRYYTETEMDSLLADKADADDLGTMSAKDADDYYTKSETDTLLLDKAPVIISSASGSIVSISDGAPLPVTVLTVDIEPVQSGTGDPSPTNVRPISGHDTATVTRTGKNLLNPNATEASTFDASVTSMLSHYKLTGEYAKGYYTNSSMKQNAEYWTTFTPCKAGKTYTASDTNGFATVCFLDDSGNIITQSGNWSTSYTHTTLENEKYIMCGLRKSDMNITQIELSSTVTAYEAPQIQTVTIDLDGTRYGGTLNVLTGEMTVTKAIVDLGTLTWSYATDNTYDVFYTPITQLPLEPLSKNTTTAKICISSSLKCLECMTFWNFANVDRGDATLTFVSGTQGTNRILVRYDTTTNISDFTTAMDGVQLVYDLLTPFTVQLTPAQIQTLLGTNNIWSDTGDVAVEYRADSKMYIDQKIAESQRATRSLIAGIETAMVASKNYAEGDLIIVGDTLYKTTATIASEATLTVGINVAVTTVAEQLIALANA